MQQLPQDRYMWVGNLKTRYWSLGTGGSAIVLIHGIGSAIETWMSNVEALAQTHRVYVVDLMGSGRTDKPSGSYSIEALAEFVKAFADGLKLDRFSVIGNSMGGAVALKLTDRCPESIEALVLVNSLGLGQQIAWSLRLANLPLADRVYRPTRSSTALTLKQAVANPALITDELVDRFYALLSLPGAPAATIAQIRATVDWSGVRAEVYQPIVDRLATTTAPTLIIWGEQDPILPVAHAQIAAQHLPNAQLQLFDRCGHWSHFEQADAFNAAVSQFLAALPQR